MSMGSRLLQSTIEEKPGAPGFADRTAVAAGTAAIMPYYGVPMDQTDENVAMSFNKTLLKNAGPTLPLSGRPRLFVKNIDASVAAGYGEVVASPEEADPRDSEAPLSPFGSGA